MHGYRVMSDDECGYAYIRQSTKHMHGNMDNIWW